MTVKKLYRTKRVGGGTTVSPVEPTGEHSVLFRVIADEGKAVTKDGVNLYACLDVENASGFYEVEAPPENEAAAENESI